MQHRKLVLLAAWAAVAAVCLGATASIDPASYLNDVRFLASPALRGRGDGSPELERAAGYIAGRFRAFGLEPVTGQSYLQAFQVTTGARLGKQNAFSYSEDGHKTALVLNHDFIPFSFSAKTELAGAVVFAGYGITAPEYGYDDYAGIDVKGKIVLILRHEPQEFDEKSVFSGKVYTSHAQLASKASNARMHGATGVVIVSDRAQHKGDGERLEKFAETVGPADAGIGFVQVKSAVVEKWFAAAGKSLEQVETGIDQQLRPRSFALPASIQIEANLDVERDVKTVHNVSAYLPGTTDEYIVIGAHYDHLGLGEQFSMAPSQAGKAVHPGADDNASGTAGVIELARWFSSRPKPRRGVLFLAFAGEELGLLGSSFYVNHPELPLDKAVAMINMDMIGRIRDGKVFIGGTGSGTTLRPMLEQLMPKYGALKIDFSDVGGYGSSDHTSFTTRQVPVLFFFSGLHSDYHKPSDTWDKIDAPAAVTLLGLVSDVADNLMEAPGRPGFVRTAPAHGAMPAGGGSGYGPWFGSVPDFGQSEKGVKFADVTPGSPAAAAGLKAGDIMVEFDGKPIGNLFDFTYALRAHKPGDAVNVKFLRDGQPLETKVTLGKRKIAADLGAGSR